jgi:toxin FitB
VLLDNNIIIYAAQPEYPKLRELIANHSPAISALSYLEVVGYHLLTEQQRQYFDSPRQKFSWLEHIGMSADELVGL